MRLPGAAGALTVDGAVGVTIAEVTVGDAVVVAMRAAASCGADTAGAVVPAALTETVDAVTALVGHSVADGSACVDFELLELVAVGVASAGFAADSGVGFFVGGVDSVVVLPLEVLVVPVLVTEVLAPPDACTRPACGSLDDPGCVVESVDVCVVCEDDDVAVPVLVVSVLGVDDADGEPLDAELLLVSVDDAPVVSASAIAGLLAIDTPNPSVTANAPTRPIYLA
ncbi:hypothetical protein [Mycobacterium sp.]|uniref:hypothetical protein n=1 Tax=Mycobacterium sp. TaxID=1785 RepID=UPI002BC6CA32|nr:hypothetical protein [Mycobacterium sp.]HKP40293.1 hypothetical protein [Mycobacterium sp.]